MKKLCSAIIISIFFNNCSFDNKTGIWTGSNQVVDKDRTNQNLELIFKKDKDVLEERDLASNQNIVLENPRLYQSWPQSNQNRFNNINNLNFANSGSYEKYIKISNTKINKDITIYKNKLFFF